MLALNKCYLNVILTLCCVDSIFSQQFSKQFSKNKFWLSNTELPKYDAQRVKRSAHQCEELAVQIQKIRNLTLCLFRESILSYGFLDEKTFFKEDGNGRTFIKKPLHDMGYVRITGYVIDRQNTSKVDGYLLKDKLLGRIFVDDEVFYVEELLMYLPGLQESEHSIVFKVPKKSDFANPYNFKRRRRRETDAEYYEGKEMHVAVHLDPAWYILMHRYCKKRAVFSVVHTVHVMNAIYRSTDFFSTGRPNNIGFFLAAVHMSKNNYKLVYGPYMSVRLIDARVLYRFEVLPVILQDKSVDMHMLYTAQETMEGVNGVSPLGEAGKTHGGICAATLNVMFIAALNRDYFVEGGIYQHETDAATAHEMGHSFGANHDPENDAPDNDPDAECRYYLMGPTNDKADDYVKGFQFSKCSIREILPVLVDDSRRKCFHEAPPDNKPFCGNRLVEQGEECDCGNNYWCKHSEDCCNSFDSMTGPPCTYRVDQSGCTPPEGLCCTGKCQYRNLTHIDLSCGPHCTRGCPCHADAPKSTDGTSCACGISGQCVADECHSAECTRVGLTECMCPTKSADGCRTCCRISRGANETDECLEAPAVTQYMLDMGKVTWQQLENSAVKSQEIKTAIYREFCGGDNSGESGRDKCVWLMFRQFPHGEYCLSNGHVGKCTVHSICVVEKQILHRQNKQNKLKKKSN